MGGGTRPVQVRLLPLPGTSGSLSYRGCRMRELQCFGIFWTCAHFLRIIIFLICFLRLFIEKLPKHRDYKSAVIPEKKDTLKVGLHSHWCPSKSFRVAHTDFKVKVGVSVLSTNPAMGDEASSSDQYEVAGGILNCF